MNGESPIVPQAAGLGTPLPAPKKHFLRLSFFKLITIILLGALTVLVAMMLAGAMVGCMMSLGCTDSPLGPFVGVVMVILLAPIFFILLPLQQALFPLISSVSIGLIVTALFQIAYLYLLAAVAEKIPGIWKWAVPLGVAIALVILGLPLLQQ